MEGTRIQRGCSACRQEIQLWVTATYLALGCRKPAIWQGTLNQLRLDSEGGSMKNL